MTVLDQVHALTPGSIFPVESPDQVARAVTTLNANPTIPEAFKSYRSKLKSHLQSLDTFFQASKEASEKNDAKVFMNGVHKHILRNKKTLVEKSAFLAQKLPAKERTQKIVDLLEVYKESIEPNPEPEFHRALKEMKIRYDCDFDQIRDHGGDPAEEEEPTEAED